jgi:hypothetical protein
MIPIPTVIGRVLPRVDWRGLKDRLLGRVVPRQSSLAVAESNTDAAATKGESADLQVRFAAWEAERAAVLERATALERAGLRLLRQATLLRTSITFEDHGQTALSVELRQHADTVDDVLDDAMSGAARPALRLVHAEPPLDRGA